MRDNENRLQASQAAPAPVVPTYTIPTDFANLPSEGRFYPENHPLFGKKDVEVKFMTTKEEDIVSNESYIKKGITIERLLSSLLVDKRIDPKSLLPGDQNAILVNARKNAYGAAYEINVTCEVCETKNDVAIDLNNDDFLIKSDPELAVTNSGTFFVVLPISKLNLELKLLTSSDESEVEAALEKKIEAGLPAEPLTTRLMKMIVSVNGDASFPVKAGLVSQGLLMRDSDAVKDAHFKANPAYRVSMDTHCKMCASPLKGVVPLTANFFWPNG